MNLNNSTFDDLINSPGSKFLLSVSEFVNERHELFYKKLNRLIKEFLDKNNLSWSDFYEYSKVEKIDKSSKLSGLEIFYKREPIIGCRREDKEDDYFVGTNYKLRPHFKEISSDLRED